MDSDSSHWGTAVKTVTAVQVRAADIRDRRKARREGGFV